MRKITKANARKFVKEVKSILQEHNAESIGNIGTMDRFKLNTKVGDLLISLEQPEDLSYCYTIFTRFEEPDKARELYNCNPYTGKNNFHLSDMVECIESFKWFLSSLIEMQKEAI